MNRKDGGLLEFDHAMVTMQAHNIQQAKPYNENNFSHLCLARIVDNAAPEALNNTKSKDVQDFKSLCGSSCCSG